MHTFVEIYYFIRSGCHIDKQRVRKDQRGHTLDDDSRAAADHGIVAAMYLKINLRTV